MVLSTIFNDTAERNETLIAVASFNEANEPMEIVEISKDKKRNNEKMEYYGEFVWNIDKLSERLNADKCGIFYKIIFSSPFYSHENGYKMCLGFIVVVGFGVRIQWHLMRGPFDDDLQWPFERAVTVDTIDPITGLPCDSRTKKLSDYPNDNGWQKPSRDRNDPLLFLFITIEEISTLMAQQNNDQLSIKCAVEDAQTIGFDLFTESQIY